MSTFQLMGIRGLLKVFLCRFTWSELSWFAAIFKYDFTAFGLLSAVVDPAVYFLLYTVFSYKARFHPAN